MSFAHAGYLYFILRTTHNAIETLKIYTHISVVLIKKRACSPRNCTFHPRHVLFLHRTRTLSRIGDITFHSAIPNSATWRKEKKCKRDHEIPSYHAEERNQRCHHQMCVRAYLHTIYSKSIDTYGEPSIATRARVKRDRRDFCSRGPAYIESKLRKRDGRSIPGQRDLVPSSMPTAKVYIEVFRWTVIVARFKCERVPMYIGVRVYFGKLMRYQVYPVTMSERVRFG